MKKTNTIIELVNMLKKEGIYNDKVFKYAHHNNTLNRVTYHITLDSDIVIDSYSISNWLDNNTKILVCNGIVLVTKDSTVFIRIR